MEGDGQELNDMPLRRNVLSLGDASYEREAIHRVAGATRCLTKSLT